MSTEKEKEVTETINERVNSIIEKEGHTIATFAKKIGVPWTTIKNIVSGRNAPSYDIIVKIINAVDWVDANYLIMGEKLTKGNQGNLLTIVERQNKTIESQQKTIDRLSDPILTRVNFIHQFNEIVNVIKLELRSADCAPFSFPAVEICF